MLTEDEESDLSYAMDALKVHIHDNWAIPKGWWTDLATGKPKERNVGELIALCHSELSEALEGHRKGKSDEHCPEFSSLEVELADCIIRICDMAGGMDLQLGAALIAKMKYNHTREDHKIENRKKVDGKKF